MSSSKTWAYEELAEGVVIDLGSKVVVAEEIIEFASEFDAQPFHLDEEAGKASILGGLSASGWHTCSMFMRMLCDALLLDSTSQGAPGIDYAKWKKPVLAGDVLGGKLTILSSRLSRSKPGLGFVSWRAELVNQKGEPVFELVNTCMFLTREAAQ
ncbi:acyl dehydratase [Aminobacter aminovorans]|uniref:Bifunctional aldehyde dehydrogenase/enoyl-CoA hydratase n=1 Tax=Aminobacter aminovorans TaxID=83263 RepID=A0A380WJD0_AMIAI|nr:MaoC family dehydratase [Aminobacter aminovorans]TCS29022.1 acyl dehydratase [Aminobacter aminovorans]SUU88875.1 bifunctional aldehyde dehydrogenase/enoyl-CoA hydratase [Aminobacter aminovorans]